MIDRIIAFSLAHRRLVVSLALVLVVAGFVAMRHTPIDAIPDLSENQALVYTPWAGHSPQEIEDQVTSPLSAFLQGVPGATTVRGNSELGFSLVSVIFSERVSIAAARERVQSRLARLEGFPPDAQPRLAPEAPATGQIFWYVLDGPDQDLAELRTLQDVVVGPQLAALGGVAEVASVGGYPLEYHIEVDPQELLKHQITYRDLCASVEAAGASLGGQVFERSGSEVVVRADNLLKPSGGSSTVAREQVLSTLRSIYISSAGGKGTPLSELARVQVGPGTRRGVLEMDGREMVGGVVMMRYGENPLEVTACLEQKIAELEPSLPAGVTVVTAYDRVRLIHGAIGTVSGTLLEAMLTASVCIALLLLHARTSLVVALTLPLTVLASFLLSWVLRRSGAADVQTNIMSLAGLAISVGVLVDSAIVIAENVMHTLRQEFGARPVRGDTRKLVLAACRGVGRPIFFSVLIMLLSFLPVFALGGIEGKMFRPLAFTKSFALLAAAILAITLVPVLCSYFVRGRLRGEQESWLVRTTMEVYRPVLNYLLARPAALAWLLGTTFVVSAATLGLTWLTQLVLLVASTACALLAITWRGRIVVIASLLLLALVSHQFIKPLGWERIPVLDEGTAMDMPITVPRIAVSQATDDLKMRDMLLCRFPEVEMAMGKAGRADTPTDPAPIDMIETMVTFRPTQYWPRRKLLTADAQSQTTAIWRALVDAKMVKSHGAAADAEVQNEAAMVVLPRYDGQMREFCYHRNAEHLRDLQPALDAYLAERLLLRLERAGVLLRAPTPGDNASLLTSHAAHLHSEYAFRDRPLRKKVIEMTERARAQGLIEQPAEVLSRSATSWIGVPAVWTWLAGERPPTVLDALVADVQHEYVRLWQRHTADLDRDLIERGSGVFTRLTLEELLTRAEVIDPVVARVIQQAQATRTRTPVASTGHHGAAPLPSIERAPALDALQERLTRSFARGLVLWTNDRTALGGFGGEMDMALQMPGWTNVWTKPIQNRVDMLSTGINTDVGIGVLGSHLDDVLATSAEIAKAIQNVPGVADVVVDPVRGKSYLNIALDPARVAANSIPPEDMQALLQVALGGKVVGSSLEGRARHPVRVLLGREWRTNQEMLRKLPITLRPGVNSPDVPTLDDVATIAQADGPASIKSENGQLRNYVRLNIRGRDSAETIAEARRTIAERVKLPAGVTLRWAGQFEHQQQSRHTLAVMLPVVLALIFGLLVWTYHDLADALLMLLAVPGAISGGLIMQWLCGTSFSVPVLVGYIACFGMATSTGVIMLVYLRDAVARAGGLERLSLAGLRAAVLDGAVHRLRPKLLTEATTIIGLAPMLWATGVGSEVIRPMAAPVLGGILLADEVIDLFLPVAFYWVRRWRWQKLHAHDAGSTDLPAETEPVEALAQ